MNCKPEDETLELDEQGGSNPSSKSLAVVKIVQQSNGALIPTFIYTAEAVREICKKSFIPEPVHISFLNEYDCVLDFSVEFELNKVAVDLQQISQWFSYDVVITCEVISEDKLGNIGHGREEPDLCLSLDIRGKISNPPASAHQIEQQVERATQSIMDCLVDHVGWLEAIVSKHISLNNDGQQENRYDWYHPIDPAQEVAVPTDKWKGFHSRPPKLSLFNWGRYPGNMRSVLIDGFLKWELFRRVMPNPLLEKL